MGLVQHTALSHLVFNKKTYKAAQTLPNVFGGLEMFDLNADCLSKKVYFMRWQWKYQKAMEQMMQQVFEN